MPESPLLLAYIHGERAFMILQAAGDEENAEVIGDALDTIWYRLADEDQTYLRSRSDEDIDAPIPYRPAR